MTRATSGTTTRSCAVTSCVAGDPLRFCHTCMCCRDLDGPIGSRSASFQRQRLRLHIAQLTVGMRRSHTHMQAWGEEKSSAATSQQSAGQRDAVSGEVMWPTGDIDVGGACGVWCSSLLSRVYSTPSQLAFRGQVVVLFVDSSFRRMQSSTPPQVTTSCKVCLQSAGKLLLLPAMVAPCEPCPKHDTSSKHSYTWSHCTSRVEQLRGRCRISNLNI